MAQVGTNLAALSKVGILNDTSATTHSRDGFRWHIVKKDACSGLFFDPDELVPGETYTFSYKFQKVAGTMVGVGGQHRSFTQVKWYLDGVKQSADYSTVVKISDDCNVHEASFTGIYDPVEGDGNLYFQPNRGNVTEISCYIWDVKMELGDKATPWISAWEDSTAYLDFIPENTAPAGVRRIGIYNAKGDRVGQIPLGTLARPGGTKEYSFGALADIHLQYDTAQKDFQRALTCLNEDENVLFTCIAGDLTVNGTEEEFLTYKNSVDTYSPDIPVYAVSGNHDVQNGVHMNISAYTGQPLYYTFECGKDLFIMVGLNGGTEGSLFTTEELQWLYETLEENRNRRCFVFHHVRPQDGCGNAFGIYSNDIWGGTEAAVFESLMAHYKNAHQFHGHSHLKFYLQYGSDIANIDHIFGGWSVHIPSLAVPRDGDSSGAGSIKGIHADSEGYVVDVYENGIHLRGRDFVRGEYLPIASYWLDTTLQNIEEGTYTDNTGMVDTSAAVIAEC